MKNKEKVHTLPNCNNSFNSFQLSLLDLELCGQSVHSLFESTLAATISKSLDNEDLIIRANSLIDYCDENILQHHFKDVPECWRRLMMDSGLLKVLIQLQKLTTSNAAEFILLEPHVQSLMKDLDTCCVVSGSPGPNRRSISNFILEQLQMWLTNGRDTPRVFKRTKLGQYSTPTDVSIQHPIKRFTKLPSFEWFLNHCNQDTPTPFIMPKELIEYWPAFNEHPWGSMDYLLSIAADRVVPVEIGSQYTDSDWKQKMMRFSDFVKDHIVNQETVAYLAQHDLFYQIPQLENDIIIPDYCYIEADLNEFYEKRAGDVIKNAWFGPKGTVSPLHQDPYHNLLCQVVGSKYLRLVSPQQTPFVYPREGLMTNTSQVMKKS